MVTERLRPWSEVASPSLGGVARPATAVPSRCVRGVVSGVVADRAGARADPRLRGGDRDHRRRRGSVIRRRSRSLRARGRAVPRVGLRGRRAAARAVARGDRPGGRGAALGAARAAPVRGVPARLRDRAIRLMARRIRGAGPAGAARPRGRDRDPGSVRDLDGDLDPRHRLPVGLRPRGRDARPSSSPSSRPPGASSRSRPCWSSGAGSPATSTTSWATGSPP